MISFHKLSIAFLVSCFTVFTCNCDPVWELDNQMKTEERPYTARVSAKKPAGYRTTWEKVLIPKVREMHSYCDGQCFYGPASNCSAEKILPGCEVAASLAMHSQDVNGDFYCDFFGEDKLRAHFCYKDPAQTDYRKSAPFKSDTFYTVTLQTMISNSSCTQYWNEKNGQPCRRNEFIAIAFVEKEGAQPVNEDELWYACTADETHEFRISMFTKLSFPPTDGKGSSPNPNSAPAKHTAKKILETDPHLASGAGVVFSKIYYDSDFLTFGCQFVIQESNMSLPSTYDIGAVNFRDRGANSKVKVKIITGYMNRPEQLARFPTIVKAYTGSELIPTDVIDFEALRVDVKSTRGDPAVEVAEEKKAHTAIADLMNKCQAPKTASNYIVCYTPKFRQNCVHTGRCPVLFAVEHTRSHKQFKRIKAHLFSLLPDSKSHRKVVRPVGFAAVGFSHDTQMGEDVVITCHSYGNRTTIHLSVNFGHTNIYPGKVQLDRIIHNEKTFQSKGQGQILCSWEMDTELTVNMFLYEPTYRLVIRPDQQEKLHINLKKEPVYLLIAAGNRNYPDGKIVHHDFREVLDDETFSADSFFKAARTPKLVGTSLSLGILVATIHIFNFIYHDLV